MKNIGNNVLRARLQNLEKQARNIESDLVLRPFLRKAIDKLYYIRSRNGWFPVTRQMIAGVVNDVNPPTAHKSRLMAMLAHHAIGELEADIREFRTLRNPQHNPNWTAAVRSIRNLRTWGAVPAPKTSK